MNRQCVEAQEWLAKCSTQQGFPGAADAKQSAHIRVCAECQAAFKRLEKVKDMGVLLSAYRPSEKSEEVFLAALQGKKSSQQESTHSREMTFLEMSRKAFTHIPAPRAELQFLESARALEKNSLSRAHQKSSFGRSAMAVAAVLVLMVLGRSVFDDAAIQMENENVQLMQHHLPKESGADGKPSTLNLEQPGTVEMAQIAGTVRIDDEIARTTNNRSIQWPAMVETQVSSSILLGNSANAKVQISESSRVSIVSWGKSQTQLRLHQGHLDAEVSKREKNNPFVITTDNARVTVVGTRFTVEYTARGETIVIGQSGKVRVERKDGTFVGYVTANQRVVVEASQDSSIALRQTPQPFKEAEPKTALEGTPHQAGRINARPVRHQVEHPSSHQRAQRSEGTSLALKGQQPSTAQVSSVDSREKPSVSAEQSEEENDLVRARRVLSEGDAQSALAILDASSMKDWKREALRADALVIAGEYEQAVAAYAAAGRFDGAPHAWLLSERARVEENDLRSVSAAITTWKQYIEIETDQKKRARAYLQLSKLFQRNAQTQEAVPLWRTILDVHPKTKESEVALAHLGKYFLEQKRWGEAEELFRPHLSGGTLLQQETACVGMIQILREHGKPMEAEKRIADYLDRFPNGKRRLEVLHLQREFQEMKRSSPEGR